MHLNEWEIASSSQPLALVPILPGLCSGFPDQGCGRNALQQDWKEAAVPFPTHAKIFFGLSGNSNTYKESLFSGSEQSTGAFVFIGLFSPQNEAEQAFSLVWGPRCMGSQGCYPHRRALSWYCWLWVPGTSVDWPEMCKNTKVKNKYI